MWRRVDSSVYNRLRTIKNGGFTPSLLIPILGMMLSIMLIPVIPVSDLIFILVKYLIAFAAEGFFIGLLIYYVYKNSEIRKKVAQGNNATYHPATLVRKFGNTYGYPAPDRSKSLFGMEVELNGKRRRISGTYEVLTQTMPGGQVYVVDMLGEEGRNPHSCIVVTAAELDPENLYGSGLESFETFTNAVTPQPNDHSFVAQQAREMDLYKRPLTEEEKARILAEEKSRFTPSLIVAIVSTVVTAIILISGALLRITDTGFLSVGVLDLLLVFFGMMAPCVLPIIALVCLAYYLDYSNCKKQLSDPGLQCSMLLLKIYSSYSYSRGRSRKYRYCYTMSDSTGSEFTFESDQKTKVPTGEIALVVFYKKGVRLYRR